MKQARHKTLQGLRSALGDAYCDDWADGRGGEVVEALAETFRGMHCPSVEIFNPEKLHSLIIQSPKFLDGKQLDVEECFTYLLDRVGEELSRIRGAKPIVEKIEVPLDSDEQAIREAATESWEAWRLRDDSIVHDIFRGQLKSMIRGKCTHGNISFEPFICFSLEVRGTSLQDCLRSFGREETLVGDQQWFCEVCNRKCDAIRVLQIDKPPLCLAIHLKRWKYDSGSGVFEKLQHIAEVNTTLESIDGARYELYAAIEHSGKPRAGHYVAWGRSTGFCI